MTLGAEQIATALRQQIASFRPAIQAMEVGTVLEVGDGIARIDGLPGVMASEIVAFEGGALGVALNLEANCVGAIIMGDYTGIREGSLAQGTGQIVSVPVGEALIGRVVNALGQPLDEKGPLKAERSRPVERIAPGVVLREPVKKPVQTGLKAIDTMIPIGRGQRELIIGDRQTGKTALAVDTIINQRQGDMVCIYVAIGQKLSSIAQVVATLERYGAMDHTIIVAASASDPAALQYLAPYAGCAMGEEVMESGGDALIVYDDLSKHAWAYRQISLLLRRPPGREAYPGDIFYLHSRLLERAAKLNPEHGGGSLTALPIIETQLGDLTAYVPTNVISITDGQIYLESDLFHAGVRPAVNVGLSVSRVGGAAQTAIMKQVAGRLRLDLAQYRDLAAFAQFGSELDRATRFQLERGQRATEVLKQPQYQPMPLEQQVTIVYAVTRGLLDDVPVERARAFEAAFHQFMASQKADLMATIATGAAMTPETEAALEAAIREFKALGGY
ncbi:MAG: F0F1 ATP synthase subunit alpha [Anaerolineae bacterium]|nr:F0F1 ATP synthase subunit alpha [Anaerolineae bacterium]